MTEAPRPTAILLVLVAVGGCLGGDEPAVTRDPRDLGPPEPGPMTGGLQEQTRPYDCRTDPLPVPVMPNRFCVVRSFWLAGDVALGRLPMSLTLFGGNITVGAGPAGVWNVTVEVGASAATDAAARDEARRVALAWSHEEAGGHFVRANLTRGDGCGFCLSVRANVVVPANVLLSASFSTLAGQVQVRDVEALTLVASSGAGAVSVQVRARDLVVEARGREAYVRHEATASGRVEVKNDAGPIEYAVLEDARHGQNVQASSESGAVEVRLRDGTTNGNASAKAFVTHGFQGRAIQTTARLEAASNVLVRDAALLGGGG
ncbi:MAG: hypothetical protein HYT80_03620 [Euryarchaeota archaeon]|nr:hypothetical protein [Euryarchaeota archaeon]